MKTMNTRTVCFSLLAYSAIFGLVVGCEPAQESKAFVQAGKQPEVTIERALDALEARSCDSLIDLTEPGKVSEEFAASCKNWLTLIDHDPQARHDYDHMMRVFSHLLTVSPQLGPDGDRAVYDLRGTPVHEPGAARFTLVKVNSHWYLPGDR